MDREQIAKLLHGMVDDWKVSAFHVDGCHMLLRISYRLPDGAGITLVAGTDNADLDDC